MPRGNDVAHHQLVQRVQHNVVEVGWAVFFHPGRGFVDGCIGCSWCVCDRGGRVHSNVFVGFVGVVGVVGWVSI